MTVETGRCNVAPPPAAPPLTPDGRYILVRGRLWRASNPALDPVQRAMLVDALMTARRAVGVARRYRASDAERAARKAVDAAKIGLGERGAPWWSDGAVDLNRHMARNTHYADWFAALDPTSSEDNRQSTPATTAG